MEMMNGQKPIRHFFIESVPEFVYVYLNGAFFASLRTVEQIRVVQILKDGGFSKESFEKTEKYGLPHSCWECIRWGFFDAEKKYSTR